jgi:hypothetical protein
MASYPASLPRPQIAGYQILPTDPVTRTEMEGGNSRARRRTATRRDMIGVAWKFTAAEMAIFRSWFEASDGADGGAAWWNVSLDTGDGGSLTAVESRFAGIWQAELRALTWVVTAQLEVRYA